ncbi:hypothetical protein [Vreelandella populi]|uniref:Uncharacterized protein n=1 Tax=Vreelandella populi TaxID=2498858 RepID=A0A3S0ZBY0_9GAMM|nr:hypothetical protein [Halomonas populi]RUR43390.1 hypothetical protein ELY37_16870 [Halomonas populi]
MKLIGFWELMTAAFIFTTGAFLKPLFLVFRDWAVWWLVERFILTEKLVRAARKREAARNDLCTIYSFNTSETSVDGKLVFKIDGNEISEKEYRSYSKNRQRVIETFDLRDRFIQRRIIFADKVTRHFSQHPENPVLALCKAIEQQAADKSLPKHTVHITEVQMNAQAESQAVSEVLHRTAESSK